MAHESIFLPVSALVLWTLIILTLIPFIRIRAVQGGRSSPKDFRYGESANVPGDVSLPNRDYMNLLGLPVLFYVVCLAIYATGRVDDLFVMLAWGFVAARVLHSLVHMSYNNVIHRLAVFAIGVGILGFMWARFAVGLS